MGSTFYSLHYHVVFSTKERRPCIRAERSFGWQEGYAIFSTSWTHCTVLRRYIANQEEHHCKKPFVDELKRLLERNGVQFDPKYLL